VFDKTGTLTVGTPRLLNWNALSAQNRSLALALATGSSHPLSQAIVAAGQGDGTRAADLTDLCEEPGFGTSAQFCGRRVRLGRPDWIGVEATKDNVSTALDAGDGAPQVLQFQDTMRPGAQAAVSALQSLGITVVLLSGDRAPVVAAMASRLGIEKWHAGMLPQDKVAEIKALGDKVLMVGDGLNDTAALTCAHVSISPATALDAARVASDIVLLGQDLEPIVEAISTARLATKRIRQNFGIATIYNVVAVPLAVAGLATPLIAALAMSTSSITVSLNALRLRGSR
jgi:Cu2+-exporting ATPase